jgi:signal transduction histidine kinase
MVALGWLYFQGQYLGVPHLTMPEPVRVGLYWWNITGATVGFAFISATYARTAMRMERELAEQNQELRETQAMLVQSEKMAAIGKLTAGLTHEINTPIGAILSSADTGARAVERLREQTAASDGKPLTRLLDVLSQTIASAGDAARRLSELVGRLQSLVRIDEAEVKISDLHEGIESALALLHEQTQSGSIDVICRFDRTIPQVLCRPAEINQVFMNLLQNAIDAIEGPGMITIITSQDPERVTIAIRDTGRGLKPEECEGLFDLSFSSSRSRVKLGLGLPISHQIVLRHHGELRVESALGEGSTFTVVLPKQVAVDRDVERPAP